MGLDRAGIRVMRSKVPGFCVRLAVKLDDVRAPTGEIAEMLGKSLVRRLDL